MTENTFYFGTTLEVSRVEFCAAELNLYTDLVKELQTMYGKRLLSVKLVGSRARGTARTDSDFDFLIFLDSCDFDLELPKQRKLSSLLESRHGLGPLSLSPLSSEQFLGLDAKYPGIIENFRRDAVNLWP